MNLTKLFLCVALFAAIRFTFDAAAQAPTPINTNAVATERFLVIVETSAVMQKRAENVQKALGSVISSGLSGNISHGSTIGLWTFNDKLHSGEFPLQLWTQSTRQRVAVAMVQFLQQQKYEKASRLATAWQVATNIVAQSERITLLLITSGNEPVVGTPFDAAITESFIKNSDAQRKANMPYLTILRAVKGSFVAFAVNMPPWPLEVPEYPDGFKPASAPAPPVLPVLPPQPPTPIVKRPDPAILSPTNTIYLTETSPPVDVAIPASKPRLESTNIAVTSPERPSLQTNIPAIAAPIENKPAPPIVPVVVKKPEPVPASAEVTPKTRFPIVTILVGGISLFLGIMVVFLALLRWSRRCMGTSLITHSMNKDDR